MSRSEKRVPLQTIQIRWKIIVMDRKKIIRMMIPSRIALVRLS